MVSPWRSRRWFVGIILLALIVADQRGLLLSHPQNDMVAYHGSRVRVLRVIDALTFEVDQRDGLTRSAKTQVVLWGVAAPPIEFEPAALAMSRELAGQSVLLQLEAHRTRDPFGRVLAHVHRPEGGSLNEALLEAGLVTTEERMPHALLTRFAQAQNNARRMRRGMWE